MQRVCRVRGGVNSYLKDSRVVITGKNRSCPFCPGEKAHRLRIHGTYQRQALFPDPAAPETIPVHRLLCVSTQKTVSLLPDFCLPRRQHGPSILGVFLHALLEGVDLLRAIKSVRGEVQHHSTAQALLRGFLEKAAKIRSYLAGIRHRVIKPPKAIPPRHRSLGALFHGLLHGFSDPSSAFTFHGLGLHRRFQVGLA